MVAVQIFTVTRAEATGLLTMPRVQADIRSMSFLPRDSLHDMNTYSLFITYAKFPGKSDDLSNVLYKVLTPLHKTYKDM